jgi:hypothetical protein
MIRHFVRRLSFVCLPSALGALSACSSADNSSPSVHTEGVAAFAHPVSATPERGTAAASFQSNATTRPGRRAIRTMVVTPADDGDGDDGGPPDDDDTGKVPRLRRVTPSPAPSNGGPIGGSTGTTIPSASWQTLTNESPIYAGTALLLTDGTVMVQDAGGPDWWKLTPDENGSYLNGTWTALALMPDGYQPLYFGSAVLPDGRVIVEGGEYQAFNPAWTTQGAIYDPTKDQWTPVAPPTGWQTIGDASTVVLADGRFLLSNCCTEDAAILDPKTLTWTPFGTNKADINDEEGWTLLQNDKVLTVDANNTSDLEMAEILNPRTGKWSSAGNTPAKLADTNADGSGSHEMGPQVVRPDGTVFAVGATGNTAVYHPSGGGYWTAGPELPVIAGQGQLDAADGPAALLPNGHVLFVASPGVFNIPAHVFDFDGETLVEVGSPPQAIYDPSFVATLLVLPSGEILFTDESNDVEIYTSAGKADGCSAPQIESSCSLDTLSPGQTYEISGTQLNGLSQAVAYGDDVQAATNYPLVRITNRATRHVFYSRTHDHSSMSITPGAPSHTFFDVPPSQEVGASDLVVVANGIPSAAIAVNIVAPKN